MRPTRPSQKPTSHLKPLVRLCQLALASCGALGAPHILAADITWTGAGGTTNWSEGANWLGGVAPTATDVAVFNSVVLIQPTSDISRQIDLLRFDSGATATMLVNVNDYLSLESGITNGSAVTQILAVTSGTGELRFGTGTVTGDVLIANHGLTWFGDTSSAGSLDMINNQAGTGAVVRFMAFSTGGDVIINNRADGVVVFQDNANAENLWITNAAAGSLLSTGLQRIESEMRASFLAQFDPLTGLPNRALLADRFSQMILQAGRRGAMLGVLFVDLDDFKLVNDTLGHLFGDRVLTWTAELIRSTLRASDSRPCAGGWRRGKRCSSTAPRRRT